MHDASAIGDEERDETRINLLVLREQLLPVGGIELALADAGGERLDRVRVAAHVVADVFAERRHGFTEARAAVRFLFGGRHLVADRR